MVGMATKTPDIIASTLAMDAGVWLVVQSIKPFGELALRSGLTARWAVFPAVIPRMPFPFIVFSDYLVTFSLTNWTSNILSDFTSHFADIAHIGHLNTLLIFYG